MLLCALVNSVTFLHFISYARQIRWFEIAKLLHKLTRRHYTMNKRPTKSNKL